MNNTWRPIGIYYKIKTYYLQLVGALYSLACCLTSITMALIGDKIKFKYIFIMFAFMLTIAAFSFPLSFNNPFLFIFNVMCISFIYNGYNIIIDPYMIKIYGIDNYIKIGGAIRASEGVCEIFSIIFAFYLENYISLNKDYIYKFMFIISGCFNLLSLILGFYENEE